jgi:hypothetical protein
MQCHGLVVLWWSIERVSRLPPFSNKDRCNIGEPENDCEDGIRNYAALRRIVSKLEAQATIDDAEGDDDAAEPDVPVRSWCSGPDLLVVGVVEGTEDWLKKGENKENNANDGVGLVGLGTQLVYA